MDRAYSTYVGEERFVEGIVGKPEETTLFERPRRIWEDNIKMDFREVGWGHGWIDLAQDRERWRALVNAVMNLWVP